LQQPTVRPAADGLTNFGEWVLGGDPAAPDSYLAALAALPINPAPGFRFEYQRLSNAAGYGLQYRYLISEDLHTWIDTTPLLISTDPNEDPTKSSRRAEASARRRVVMQLAPAAVAGKSKLFLRVRAEGM
jgi:hypothetical protein